jgi:alpha-ketoglutaric semialdehyde dehydrogenase
MNTIWQVETSEQDIHLVVEQSARAFQSFKLVGGQKRAAFLRSIAYEIESLGDQLIEIVQKETHLSRERIVSERQRTIGHCMLFADYIENGLEREVSMSEGNAYNIPSLKPKLRKMLFPIGPIAVFGAANFPLAYSTAGGDTISALASGCTVIAKAHPAHPHTCFKVEGAIQKAAQDTGMPDYVFQQIYGGAHKVGKALVTHPAIKAVGFTGSFVGGKALYDLVQTRKEPIPFFAEMSSINPVILLPGALEKSSKSIAASLVSSMTTDMGQFCTCPGLLITLAGAGQAELIEAMEAQLFKVNPQKMLHQGIADNYRQQVEKMIHHTHIKVIARGGFVADSLEGQPIFAKVDARHFLESPTLSEEVFGPFSILVNCRSEEELLDVVKNLSGQLTMTVHAEKKDQDMVQQLVPLMVEKAGRLIFNGVPTGVEVNSAQVHGGPFPATTDSRFTAVGPEAVKRFMRPVTFQNFPEEFLPKELKKGLP